MTTEENEMTPTAQEVLDAICDPELGGAREGHLLDWWSMERQRWEPMVNVGWIIPYLMRADRSTPQPNLRIADRTYDTNLNTSN